MIDLGHLIGELPTVALREAAGDDELFALAVLLHRGEFEDGVDRFALGFADEPAGVHHDDFRIVGVVRNGQAGVRSDPEHHLRVDLVLRATEADEVNFAGFCRRAHRPGP